MKIGAIGAGNVGGTLAKLWREAGHDVRAGGRDSVAEVAAHGEIVLLAVPADTQADVEARCLNGSFSSELPLSLASTQRPRETHGRLGKGGSPIKLHTVNGGIRVVALRSTV